MSKYSPISDFLNKQPPHIHDKTVSFDTLEDLIGDMLPESAYTYQAWWGNEKNKSRSQARSWMEAGWKVESVDLSKLQVRFRKVSGTRIKNKTAPIPLDQNKIEVPDEKPPTPGVINKRRSSGGKRIVLISCVKSKTTGPNPAQDLYISDLFQKSSAYAKLIGDSWYILSAKYGLLSPDQVIEPYEKTLNEMGVGERKSWAKSVMSDLAKIVTPGDEVVFLAGVKYRENLIQPLTKMGSKISVPMEGLSFGNQLKWLKNQLG